MRSRQRIAYSALCIFICTAAVAQQNPSAPASRPAQTTASSATPPIPVATAENAARFRADIKKIEDALPRLKDRGAGLFFLARRHTQLGELQQALSLLEQCVALEEGFEPGDSDTFGPLRPDSRFQALAAKARRGRSAVHRAHVAFTIPQPDLIPEGIAVDPANRLFYLGSVTHRKIIKVSEAGDASDFVPAGRYQLLPFNGVRVDTKDHSVWGATSTDDVTHSELVHFDQHGKLVSRVAAPGPGVHDFNDLVVRDSDAVYVTDTRAHEVYRYDLKAHTLRPFALPRPLLYPNGIALSDDHNQLYVADSLGVILVSFASGSRVEVHPGARDTLAGIDGLYWNENSLIGIQYGTGPYRVMRWKLSPDGSRVTSAEVLEYRTDLVIFPTTGAILGDKLYFMANTGIGNLKNDQIADPSKLEPLRIAVVSLK